jgi:predicted metal-dependent hydrolase
VLQEEYTLLKKDVKHARIRVSEDGHVRVLIPNNFSEGDISALLEKKARWISKQQDFFKKKSRIELSRNEILLYGRRYAYFYDDEYERKILIDHESKTIRAKRDLLDHTIQKKWYKAVAKQYLIVRTEKLAEKLNFEYNSIFIRDQRTKLGNCSEEKNISLNWRLVKAPDFVSDYIILHELVHTKIMSHSSKFWMYLKSIYPDYKKAMKWLDEFGNSL